MTVNLLQGFLLMPVVGIVYGAGYLSGRADGRRDAEEGLGILLDDPRDDER